MNRSVEPTSPPVRRHLPAPVLAGLGVAAAGWLALGAPLLLDAASANTPLGWSDPKPVNFFHALLLLGGVPLLLFAIITFLVMAPSFARRERTSQTGGGELESWFGGPQRDSSELQAAAPDTTDEKGGAGGRW